jgi:hypothetical protein
MSSYARPALPQQAIAGTLYDWLMARLRCGATIEAILQPEATMGATYL